MLSCDLVCLRYRSLFSLEQGAEIDSELLEICLEFPDGLARRKRKNNNATNNDPDCEAFHGIAFAASCDYL